MSGPFFWFGVALVASCAVGAVFGGQLIRNNWGYWHPSDMNPPISLVPDRRIPAPSPPPRDSMPGSDKVTTNKMKAPDSPEPASRNPSTLVSSHAVTGPARIKSPITQKSTGTQSPNIITSGEGATVQIIYGDTSPNSADANNDKTKDKRN